MIYQQYLEKNNKIILYLFAWLGSMAKWTKKTRLYKLIDEEYEVEILWYRVQLAMVAFLLINIVINNTFDDVNLNNGDETKMFFFST